MSLQRFQLDLAARLQAASIMEAWGDGGYTFGIPPSTYTSNSSLVTLNGINAETVLTLNPGNSGAADLVANSLLSSANGTPVFINGTNLSNGNFIGYGIGDGNGGSANNVAYIGMAYTSAGASQNAVEIATESGYTINASSSIGLNGNGHVTIPFAADDGSGALLQVNGGAEFKSGTVAISGTETAANLQLGGGTVLSSVIRASGTLSLPAVAPQATGTCTVTNSAFAAGGYFNYSPTSSLPLGLVPAGQYISSGGTATILFTNPTPTGTGITTSTTALPIQFVYAH
jgi:hypothetical protein